MIRRADGAFDGYTLFAPLRSSVMRLIDTDGDVVHEWRTVNAGYGVLLESGNLLTLGSPPEGNPRFRGPGVNGGLLQELDWDGNVVWSHVVNDERVQVHHDVDVLPNGNLLYVVREFRSREGSAIGACIRASWARRSCPGIGSTSARERPSCRTPVPGATGC